MNAPAPDASTASLAVPELSEPADAAPTPGKRATVDDLARWTEDARNDAMGRPSEDRTFDAALRQVRVEVQVLVGQVEMTIAELLDLAPDQQLDLDRGVKEPLELQVNGRTIATGHLVSGGDGALGLRVESLGELRGAQLAGAQTG